MTQPETALHPGDILKRDFLDKYLISAGQVAKAVRVPRTRIERIVAHDRGITPDTAFRLARLFGNTPEFWLDLQRAYELAQTAKDEALAFDLERITPIAT